VTTKRPVTETRQPPSSLVPCKDPWLRGGRRSAATRGVVTDLARRWCRRRCPFPRHYERAICQRRDRGRNPHRRFVVTLTRIRSQKYRAAIGPSSPFRGVARIWGCCWTTIGRPITKTATFPYLRMKSVPRRHLRRQPLLPEAAAGSDHQEIGAGQVRCRWSWAWRCRACGRRRPCRS